MSGHGLIRVGIAAAAILSVILGFQNCSNVTQFRSDPMGPPRESPQGTSSGNPTGSGMTYKIVSNSVFVPKCVSCHSEAAALMPGADDDDDEDASKIRYDSYANTLAHGRLGLLLEHYSRFEEPDDDCDPATREQMEMVVRWISEGAPE